MMKKSLLVLMLVLMSTAVLAVVLRDTDSNQFRRSAESLTIEVTTPGTLGELIQKRVNSYDDVQGLTVSGTLNDNDVTVLMLLKNIVTLDMEKTNVITIPNEFMLRRSSLVKVVFPEVLESIGYRSFYGCLNLKEFSFPSTLKVIGEDSFYGCAMPGVLVIPEGVTTIGGSAFYGTGFYDEHDKYVETHSNLKELSLPSTLTSWSWCFPFNESLQKITLADGITVIGNEAFNGCYNLSEVHMPQTLREIGSWAFSNCSSLTEIEIPEGVTCIRYYAFSNCTSLNNVILPTTLNSIDRPFINCIGLTKMTIKAIIPPSTSDYNLMGGIENQCTLTVPNLSLNNYKTSRYWSNFSITGEDFLPDRIIISNDFTLGWESGVTENWHPELLVSRSYAENYYWADSNVCYGALTIAENTSVNLADFSMLWDRYLRINDSNTNPQNATLISKSSAIKSDKVSITVPLYSGQWHFMVLPFDCKVSDIVEKDDVPYAIRKYSGSNRATGDFENTWINLKADDVIKAGEGFIIQCAYDYNYTGDNWRESSYNEFTFNAVGSDTQNNIFDSNNVTVPLSRYDSEFAHNRSWNFVGNPYPCYYSIKGMQTTAPITVWNSRDWKYDVYSPQDDEYVLQPGEGFFVQCSEVDEGITFSKDYRMLHYDDELASRENRAASISSRHVYNLSLKGDKGQDCTRFVVNQSASLSYEIGCDAVKFEDMVQPSIQLYTLQDAVRYAINERPLDNGEIKLGMELLNAGTFTFSLNTNANGEVYLIDSETGKEVRLDSEDYTFTAGTGTIVDRFKIRLVSDSATGISVIDNTQPKDATYYDLQGRQVKDAKKGVYIWNGKKVVVK